MVVSLMPPRLPFPRAGVSGAGVDSPIKRKRSATGPGSTRRPAFFHGAPHGEFPLGAAGSFLPVCQPCVACLHPIDSGCQAFRLKEGFMMSISPIPPPP